MVLAKGRQLFIGPPADVHAWFTTGLGLLLPPHVPLADFVVDMANVDFEKGGLYGWEGDGDGESKDTEADGAFGGEYGLLRSVEDLNQARVRTCA
jgi:hypothetical protein